MRPALSLLLFRKPDPAVSAFGLWFVVLFPLAYVVSRGSILYDAIRHLLFVYPPLVALAAGGWVAARNSCRTPVLRGLVMLVLVAGLIEPLTFQLRNHPNQVVYFNQLVGGPRGAFGRFELDY